LKKVQVSDKTPISSTASKKSEKEHNFYRNFFAETVFSVPAEWSGIDPYTQIRTFANNPSKPGFAWLYQTSNNGTGAVPLIDVFSVLHVSQLKEKTQTLDTDQWKIIRPDPDVIYVKT
jgi:hypothetical protein